MSNQHIVAIFAASGAISSAVARALARQGSIVHISARDEARVHALAESIRAAGGQASAAVVDALDERAVQAWLDQIIARHGRLDMVFNGIGARPQELKYPARSLEQPLEDMLLPIQRIVGSQFLTARCAAKVMAPQRGGAIVLLSATLSGMAMPYMAGISAACGAVEAMTRSLAGELGPQGIRVNCVRGSAMPETRTIQETGAGQVALGATPLMVPPPLGRPITVDETANVAAFLGGAGSSGMTGQVVTVCAGAFVG